MTGKITVTASDEALDYMYEIAQSMSDLFGVPMDNAIDRVNFFWAGQTFLEEDDMIFHELPEFWAKTIYYGPEVKWWLDGKE